MGFNIIVQDITKVKCDAILNSLGTNSEIYGAICRSIVKVSKSDELKNKVDSFGKDLSIGEALITDGYSLPAKKIFHIVTSFYQQDKQLFALEGCYLDFFTEAINQKWSKVAVPLIGTGANGYPHAYVLDMITSLANVFAKKYPKLNITICISKPSKNLRDELKDELEFADKVSKYYDSLEQNDVRSFEFNEDMLSLSFKEVSNHFKRQYTFNANENNNYFKSATPTLKSIKRKTIKFDSTKLPLLSITDYVEKYAHLRYGDVKLRKQFVNNAFKTIGGEDSYTSKKSSFSKENKRTTVQRATLFRFVFALEMNLEEASDFLNFCGVSLSPVDKQDMLVKETLKCGCYDQNKINGLWAQEGFKTLFPYTGEINA